MEKVDICHIMVKKLLKGEYYMTNCNRKITEKKSRENQGRIEKMNVYIPIVSMVISVKEKK